MLPLVGQNLAERQHEPTSVLMAGLIVAPQLVVGLLSPWVGHHSERFGRKPLFLLGFGLEVVRALLFAFFTEYWILVVAQAIGGISAAAVTVLTILVITDLTTGTGRFNLVHGFIGTVIALAAAASMAATGFIFQALGQLQGFMILAGVGAIATVLFWIAMPETKPGKYID
jgi:MFS family permease